MKVKFRSENTPGEFEVEAAVGASLMAAAKAAKVAGIEAICGGSMVCGTCHVYVDEAWRDRLDPPSDTEAEVLSYGVDPRPGSRLACQITIRDTDEGLTVTTPSSQV